MKIGLIFIASIFGQENRQEWTEFLNSCSEPLGLSDGRLKDHAFSATSEEKYALGVSNWGAYKARLHNKGYVNAWRPKTSNRNESITVDLGNNYVITKIAVQGAGTANPLYQNSWLNRQMGKAENNDILGIEKFRLHFSKDGSNFSTLRDPGNPAKFMVFRGNDLISKDDVVTHYMPEIKTAQFVKLQLWEGENPGLRMEIYGCETSRDRQIPRGVNPYFDNVFNKDA